MPQNQLDPQAVSLAKAIRQTESGGDFNAKGKSGEHGAYQFTAPTWQKMSAQAGVNAPLEQSTPEQQNQVAYTQIKKWKDSGFNPGQIASMWNAGEEEPDAYKGTFSNGSPSTGTNKYNVKFDVPAYAKSVAKAYQTLKQGGQVGVDPQNPSSTAAPQEDNSLTGNPVIDGVANFLFPIAGDIKNDIQGKNSKTGLQQAGDLGLSVLPFVPGLGELGEGARGLEGAGMLTKLLANRGVQGAAMGYGYGALGNLSAGKSLGESVSPNEGTLGGAALGGLTNTLLPKILAPFAKNFTKSGAQSALEDSLNTEATRLKPTLRILGDMPNGGKEALATIARTPDALPKVVDNHHFDTTQGQEIMSRRASTLSQLRAAALQKMGTKFSLTGDLQRVAVKMLNDKPDSPTRLQDGERLMQTILEYARNYGGDEITPTALEAIKEANPYASPLARAARQLLEEQAQTAGSPDLKLFNNEIRKHIHAKAILEKMNGQVVKGGRLGSMLRGHTAGMVGGLAGDAMGGGWLGTLGGALAGEGVSKLFSSWQANTSLTTPLQEALLERLQQEDPEIVQQYARYVGNQGQVTPQRTAPQPSAVGGILRNLLLSGAARTPAAVSQ